MAPSGPGSRPGSPPGSPPGSRPGALLLAPGAGADSSHHTLAAVAGAVGPLPVRRLDFPYRKAGRKVPDRAPVAVAAVRAEAAALLADVHVAARRLVLGGRSFGGRMCTLAVAEGLPAAGLLLLSYPLHPPGRPERLRTEHFGALDVPCLFISGRKDPFASPDELEREAAVIPGPVTMVWVDGGHDPRNADEAIAQAVVEWLAGLG